MTNIPWKLLKTPCALRVTAGFDGYIDTIVRAVRRKTADGSVEYFPSIAEFGAYIGSKAGKSASLEFRVQSERAGGNLPLFAGALSALGAQIDLIGALGWPQVHPLFRPLEQTQTVHSVCAPGLCEAVEFDDGKLMLARNEDVEALNAELLLSRLPEAGALFARADWKVLLNWSELPGQTSIWRALLPQLTGRVFVDLSDCSLRPADDRREALDLLTAIAAQAALTLSLNRNEAEQLGQAAGLAGDAEQIVRALQARLPHSTILLHLTDGAHAYADGEYCSVPNRHIEHPLLSTGGGDNFNAGYVFAAAHGLPLPAALAFANHVSGWYVSHGASPCLANLLPDEFK